MKDFQNLYETSCEHSYDEGLLRFFFVSEGEVNIVKTVEYQFVSYFDGRPLFNLAFGDFDVQNGSILDREVSNNGDTFKVFHTVLSTIPTFFESFGDIMLMVQGSDSRPEFTAACRDRCTRHCGTDECKKAHRRINIYRGFVDKNLDELGEDYIFHGGEVIDNNIIVRPYVRYGKYDTVFVIKKMHKFAL